MSSIIKKLFGTLLEKPWEESQALIDNKHVGKTFGVTNQMSAVIIIFGISTAIFSLIFTAYLYSIPPEQDTTLILKNKLNDSKLSEKMLSDLQNGSAGSKLPGLPGLPSSQNKLSNLLIITGRN